MTQIDEQRLSDLRERVARDMRATLHGKEVDLLQDIRPALPHMLGITEIGEVAQYTHIDGTILDPTTDFWDTYYKTVETRNAAKREVRSAIESLRSENLLRLTYPYGEDAGIVYVEVSDPDQYRFGVPEQNNSIQTSCKNCGQTLRTAPELVLYNDYYYLRVMIECDECGFTGSYERKLLPQ